VKLRLPPDVAEDLDELAARWGLTRSGTVARLLEERRGDRSPHPTRTEGQ
jgi:predicted DNA-binding protein